MAFPIDIAKKKTINLMYNEFGIFTILRIEPVLQSHTQQESSASMLLALSSPSVSSSPAPTSTPVPTMVLTASSSLSG
jgi:hypothetical protein